MATDVDVQYFSHLNGLTLSNNWGDLIRLLDKALVTGVDFTQITAASIDAQGDVHITLYAAHNAMLFQVVELSGFTPASLNQKYRIKGVPSATELILKPHAAIVETNITIVGAGKLASLGYEIIFRDTNDVKRVYRAKNPTAQHPFIRVDESLTSPDGTTGVYTSTYAKYAMVGLLEHMEHIDDYENPDVLQLPFDPSDPAKNWKIAGTDASVVRGWSRWHYASNQSSNITDTNVPANGNREFTLIGDKDAFYMHTATRIGGSGQKNLRGCGLFNASLPNDVIPNWFLMTYTPDIPTAANSNYATYIQGYPGLTPLNSFAANSAFFTPKYSPLQRISKYTKANPILPDYATGATTIYAGTDIAALEVPFVDTEKCLRGTLKYVYYAGNNRSATTQVTPLLAENSMYLWESMVYSNEAVGGVYYYLGEIE
ncbi:hypothetical protein [Acinetobacter radioresistens]|uniref:hypothetical protein n=1 Tax=Acinetobacter radioresistens TaxID=40216 RepID=UPI00124D6C14|nr:hypothetical protein [Acinetobacter radioresistens]